MSEDLLRTIGLLIGFYGALLLWGLAVVAVFWDLNRRVLPQREKILWLALAGLMPGWGALAYLLSRLLGFIFAPSPNPGGGASDAPLPGIRGRFTRLKKAPVATVRTGTIPAADLFKPTIPTRGAAQPLRIRLVVMAGPHQGEEFRVETFPARLGRGSEALVQLERDLGVSRQHAEIYQQEGALRLRNLRSTHGTSINGFNIDDKVLELGDKIELGASALIVKGVEV